MGVNNYNKLRKKYNLPDHKKLSERLEIEIDTSKTEVLVIQEIRNQITERLYDFMKNIESILFTSEGSDPSQLYQEDMIKTCSKEGFELFREFNHLYFEGVVLSFKHDRKADSAFINKIFNSWHEIEKKLLKFFGALEKGWEEFDGPGEMGHETYHG